VCQKSDYRRSDEHFAVAVTNNQRRFVARANDQIRLSRRNGAKGEVSLEATRRGTYGIGKSPVDVLLDEVRHNLSVGLATKPVTTGTQLGAQLLVILDDSVEHDRHCVRAIVVRMSIGDAGSTVCSPARMAETNDSITVIVAGHVCQRRR
jgi:hypothetical protein